ncbi:MAG TPA: tyrosine-type recombinase/integrase [Candidatus Paceibacterota bacterium]|nr:tyrosine-type recombinase/integrase [Verrucomicrobiota bacterium]HOX03365.1 tyrosine-type recombinase/integrase [Verrucomicrobiota bacterium]HRZ46285.1 tyrosine-type recombinase/integrase [Candidatus Paceibacterota bacterium]
MRRGRFPQRIKRGSCVVTIYRTPNKGYTSFTVAHYDASGKFRRRTFADHTQAREAATATAENLAEGKADALVLTGNDLLIYRRAREALQSVGVNLDVAAIQFVQSMQNGNGAANNGATFSGLTKTVTDVVDELLDYKRAKGRSLLYLTDLRIRLTRFSKAVHGPINQITSQQIDDFLKSLGVSGRSQNNFRSTVGTLLRFAQMKGYVGRDHPGVSHVEKASQTPKEIVAFTPDEIQRLLLAAKDELVPALAIGAFGGVRSQELKRLRWEDIKMKRGHIEIKGANSKTGLRRLIPMPRNLRAWLLPSAKAIGPVTPFTNLALQFAKLARSAGIRWKKNGLRHSFISYRVAQTGNVAAVSLEAGNSPQVIRTNYLKVVTRAEARRWFGVYPNSQA